MVTGVTVQKSKFMRLRIGGSFDKKKLDMHLIGVGDEERALTRTVVVQHIHDLYRSVGLAGSGGAHDHRQSGLDARHDRLHL